MLKNIHDLIKNINFIKILIIITLSLYSIIMLLNISLDKEMQHDFKAYYYAAKAHNLDKNPYNTDICNNLTVYELNVTFIYSPITLYIFKPFTYFDYNTAHIIFLFLKFTFLIALIYIWMKILIHKNIDYIFLLFCFVAFTAAIFKDFTSGNISIFEFFFIWLAFYYFIKEKYNIFSILIIIVSCFKILPILFLFLLLFCENKYKYLNIIISFISFFLIHLITFLIDANLFHQYIILLIKKFFYLRYFNESILYFIQYLYGFLNFTVINYRTIYLLYFFLISIVFIKIIGRLKCFNIDRSEKNKLLVFFFCSTYFIMVPNLGDYSFILLILPTYYIIDIYKYSKLSYLLLIFSTIQLNLLLNISMFNNFSFIIKKFNNLFIAFLVWFSYIYFLYNYDYINNKNSITMDENNQTQKNTY